VANRTRATIATVRNQKFIPEGTSQAETTTPITAVTSRPAETKKTIGFRKANCPNPFTIASAVIALKATE
jgi:hypothetical protein